MNFNSLPFAFTVAPFQCPDPGASGTLDNTQNGRAFFLITTAAAESRTLNAPLHVGQEVLVALDTDGGDLTLTVTSGQGVSSVVLDDAGDWVALKAITVGETLKWVVSGSYGAASGVTTALPALTIATADALTVGGVIVPQAIEVSFVGQTTEAATDRAFFVANRAYQVTAIRQVHSVAAGGASTLQVTKDTSTNAPGAGTNLLTNNTNAGFDLNATANTVQTGSLSATASDLQLAAGDRLSIDFANTIQSTAGLVVTVQLKPI